ncbi:HD domain-containing phosphohydrolase [Rhodospirillaceae bacterium SYSU D60014]|uniref:HD domain-containing phosphohydrolase n=1 Tax=Virgifigura deserti TaxID=2268457 RepID=UPI000E66EBBD
MAQQSETAPSAVRRPADLKLALSAAALLLVGLVGVLLVFRFIEAEREREFRIWQARLGIVAESRSSAVQGWLTAQLDEMTGLAENAALQLYLSEIVLAGDDPERLARAQAQTDYLRNLLVVTADRSGFAAPGGGTPVQANLPRIGAAGLALVDRSGRVVVATPGMPPVDGALGEFIRAMPPAERGLLDPFLNRAGAPSMAFAAPVFAIQSNPDPSTQIGFVVGVKEVADELYPLLRQPGETSRTGRAVLVRPAGAMIEYLSPLPGGEPPLSVKMARDTPNLAAAFAIENPGGFAVRHDITNHEVLLTSRPIATAPTIAPWTLIYQIDRDEALADSETRLHRLLAMLLLAIALAGVVIVAVWRHGSSRRAARSASQYRQTAEQLDSQRRLLRVVTDSQPTSIFILDPEGRYRFANRQVSRIAGIAAADMTGKPIGNVLGPDVAKRYLTLNRQALESGQRVSNIMRSDGNGQLRVMQSEHIPLDAPNGMPDGVAGGVLVVERDITDAVTEREKRSRILDQLVKTLVGIVDRRDPFAADHSSRVALIARAIAAEMGLSVTDIDTAETAGNLLNLGKILVTPDLLTRSGALSDSEREQVRISMQTSADMLQGIEFDGPVVETLRQAQARWDGTGIPAGLAGEDILITARIIAVANAFIGMISRRAHRAALTMDQAIEVLLDEVGTSFDRRVVAALINYLDNHGGRARWSDLEDPAVAS